MNIHICDGSPHWSTHGVNGRRRTLPYVDVRCVKGAVERSPGVLKHRVGNPLEGGFDRGMS